MFAQSRNIARQNWQIFARQVDEYISPTNTTYYISETDRNLLTIVPFPKAIHLSLSQDSLLSLKKNKKIPVITSNSGSNSNINDTTDGDSTIRDMIFQLNTLRMHEDLWTAAEKDPLTTIYSAVWTLCSTLPPPRKVILNLTNTADSSNNSDNRESTYTNIPKEDYYANWYPFILLHRYLHRLRYGSRADKVPMIPLFMLEQLFEVDRVYIDSFRAYRNILDNTNNDKIATNSHNNTSSSASSLSSSSASPLSKEEHNSTLARQMYEQEELEYMTSPLFHKLAIGTPFGAVETYIQVETNERNSNAGHSKTDNGSKSKNTNISAVDVDGITTGNTNIPSSGKFVIEYKKPLTRVTNRRRLTNLFKRILAFESLRTQCETKLRTTYYPEPQYELSDTNKRRKFDNETNVITKSNSDTDPSTITTTTAVSLNCWLLSMLSRNDDSPLRLIEQYKEQQEKKEITRDDSVPVTEIPTGTSPGTSSGTSMRTLTGTSTATSTVTSTVTNESSGPRVTTTQPTFLLYWQYQKSAILWFVLHTLFALNDLVRNDQLTLDLLYFVSEYLERFIECGMCQQHWRENGKKIWQLYDQRYSFAESKWRERRDSVSNVSAVSSQLDAMSKNLTFTRVQSLLDNTLIPPDLHMLHTHNDIQSENIAPNKRLSKACVEALRTDYRLYALLLHASVSSETTIPPMTKKATTITTPTTDTQHSSSISRSTAILRQREEAVRRYAETRDDVVEHEKDMFVLQMLRETALNVTQTKTHKRTNVPPHGCDNNNINATRICTLNAERRSLLALLTGDTML